MQSQKISTSWKNSWIHLNWWKNKKRICSKYLMILRYLRKFKNWLPIQTRCSMRSLASVLEACLSFWDISNLKVLFLKAIVWSVLFLKVLFLKAITWLSRDSKSKVSLINIMIRVNSSSMSQMLEFSSNMGLNNNNSRLKIIIIINNTSRDINNININSIIINMPKHDNSNMLLLLSTNT